MRGKEDLRLLSKPHLPSGRADYTRPMVTGARMADAVSEVAFSPRPVDGYQEQGALVWLDGGPIEADPHPEGSLASADWRLGYAREALMAVGDDVWCDQAMTFNDAELHAKADRGHILNEARLASPSAEEVALAIGLPTKEWPLNCHLVATRAVASGVLAPLEAVHGAARACYGIYEGPISPTSPFAARSFARHGWIEFATGLVVDPTRWVFESTAPDLWMGSVEEYDFGANRLRRGGRRPPPAYDVSAEQLRMTSNDPAIAELMGDLLRDASRVAAEGTITRLQAFWLANLPPEVIGVLTPEVYRELDRMGCGTFVPVDNRDHAIEPAAPAGVSR